MKMAGHLQFIEIPPTREEEHLGAAVLAGLSSSPKTLPSSFFYDARGSRLFEEITKLPEYYLTRCETEILRAQSSSIFDLMVAEGLVQIVEFGSGSSEKTRLLLRAAIEKQGTTEYVPIDISGDFLKSSSQELLEEVPGLRVIALAGDYLDALQQLPSHDGPRLFLFLGSTIGNFEVSSAVAFMAAIRAAMRPGDRLLMGTDIKKDRSIIEPAYNDAQGITEQFNKNILYRIDKELCGHFNLDTFRHEAPWVEEHSRIEMRLVSQIDQAVEIEGLETVFHFKAGEYIHTENSHKWSKDAFLQMVEVAGLRLSSCWLDSKNWFALNLLEVNA